jgi:hypothetical protein
MKTLTIDLKSFFLGLLTMGAMLLMAYKPASAPATQPHPCPENRRFQAVMGGSSGQIVIIDTQTGRFVVEQTAFGRPRWMPADFDQLHQNVGK